MNIGLRIKELREKKNLSQEELGDLVGVTKQMISNYEAGINAPRASKIKRIAEIFKITEEEFYTSKTGLNLTSDTELEALRRENESLKRENELLRKIEKLREDRNKKGD
jgi:transcriptional regulator with XRE-family HTH domain